MGDSSKAQGRCTVQEQIRFESKSCKWSASNNPNFFAFSIHNTTSSPLQVTSLSFIFLPIPFNSSIYIFFFVNKFEYSSRKTHSNSNQRKLSIWIQSNMKSIPITIIKNILYYIIPKTNRNQISRKFQRAPFNFTKPEFLFVEDNSTFDSQFIEIEAVKKH